MGRGLYNQNEGSETNTAVATFNEHLSDNAIAEGREVAILRNLMEEEDWAGVNSYHQKLVKRGFSHFRLQMMMATASYKLWAK